MKKRILSLLLVLMLVIGLAPVLASDAEAATTYNKKVLSINWDNINAVGIQTYSGPCAAYALAYCRTMLDGSVHSYTEYYIDGWCHWYLGSYVNGYYTSSEQDAYKFIFQQIENGDPVVVRVTAWSSEHYVAVVGYENVKTTDSLTASNFLVIDSNGVDGRLVVENFGAKGFCLRADEEGQFQICFDDTDRIVPAGETVSNCTHKFNSDGICTKCGEWQPNQNDNAGVTTGIYKVKSGTTAYLRVHPYKLSDTAHGEPAKSIPAGSEVTVTGGVVNGLGHTWYKATYNGKTGYVYADNLTFYKDLPAPTTPEPAPEPTVPTDRASVAEGTYYLVPACAPDFRLDVATASYDEGATLQLWEPIDYDAQRFIVHDLGDALYTITAKHSNMVLDVWAAGTYSGADVKQHPWNGGKNEQWFFIDAGDGYYYIRPVHCPAMSLDVCNGDSRNAANVQIWESNSSNAQKWKLVPCDAPAESAAVQPADIHFPRVNIYHQDQFTDVKANQWFTNTVASAFEMGLMKGTSNTAFQPYGDVTIAQAITMAARIHSIASTGSENFVQTGKWYQVYLDYAYQNGIIDIAYYNSDVTRNATRAQFAEIFANSLPDNLLPAVNQVADGAVPDVPMSAACASYVYKLYRAGILAGSDATGAFHPLTYITRAEAATIVSRMADSSSRVSITLG